MYKVKNILEQRNKVILKLKNIESGKILKLDLNVWHSIPFIGEILDYTYDGEFQDIYDENMFMYSLHNERTNLNFYSIYKINEFKEEC